MPAISRIRFTNLVYEDGAKRYGDEVFQFDSHNGVILLENGGGKTVFVQAVLQTILPHIALGERKAKNTFTLGNSPAHLAVEWIIDDKPRRYVLTAVTLFASKEGLDSYKYVYEYGPGDDHSLVNLPFVREGQDGRRRPSSREEMSDYYQSMSHKHMNAQYFIRNREYQDYIEQNFKIITSEWRSIARINSAEGEIEGFFDGCRTTTQLVDQLLIPTVEEALSGKGKDFVEIFEKQREHFKKHRQLRDKIEESQRVDREVEHYVNCYASYEEARQAVLKVKGEIKSLYQLAQEQHDQVLQKLQEHEDANNKLAEERYEMQRKKASCQLAALEQVWEEASRRLNHFLQEYDARQAEHDQKHARLQNLEIARLKVQIQRREEEIDYYTGQLQRLAADNDVRELERALKDNARFLCYCYGQEEGLLDSRRQELQNDGAKIRNELALLRTSTEKLQKEMAKLLVDKGRAEQQRDQAEKEMQEIAAQILSNPAQEDVGRAKIKWEQRTQELQRNRQDNEDMVHQLQEERHRRQDELPQTHQKLQELKSAEQEAKTRLDTIQEEHESLLLKMQELRSELYYIRSIYTQQSSVVSQMEEAVESLRLLKEKAIRQESQALVLHAMYEASQCYTADPLLEQWSEEWREQFAYLETGSIYVARAARQLGRTEKEYFPAWPFWTISLICREAEADRLWERLTKKAGEMTQPVFILTQEEARAILDNALEYHAPIPETSRRVIPHNWEINLSLENFQSWKQELEQKAGEAGSERRKQEQALQLNMELFNRLQAFLEKYPHEETQQLKENLRQTREQIFEWEQRIKENEARLQDIDSRLNTLNKNITDIIEENTDISHRIMKAQDYLKKADEGDKARLAVQQYFELLQARQEQMDRDMQQQDRIAGNLQEVEKDLLLLQEKLRHLQKEALYQEVKDAAPLETVLTRSRLETERQGMLDALHKKQKGRQSLEENLSHARQSKDNAEKELDRKRRQCDTQIDEEMVFPPGGEDEIELLIEHNRHLKKELRRLQPDKEKLTKDTLIARDRFEQRQDEFWHKYRERVTFTQPLLVVEAELHQENEQIEARQRYLDEQLQKLMVEEDSLHQAMEEIKLKNGRYDYLQEDIPCVDLPSVMEQDFAYRRMEIIAGYLEAIQKNQLQLNQLKEGLEEEKNRLEAFCQEEVRDIKLQRMVTSGLKYRDNFTEVGEWKKRLSTRIAFAIRSAEDDLREHDRELQEFINRLHSYLVTIKTELRIIPRKTRVKVDDSWKEIFQFDLPEWDEKEGKDELRRYVDWMISQIESSRYRDENGNEDYPLMRKDIEKWLQPQQLLRNVMKEKNIRVRCRKVTADGKVSSHPISWESSNQWSGGEKWSKNMALFLGIQNYLAEKRQAINPGVKRSRAVILDNPFGKASSDHVLDPVFFIAGQLGFQIIALTALAEGKFVREYFPIVYSCRLRPSTNPDKYLMVTDQEIRHAYFQDHEPEALRRLGEHKQIELF